MKIVYRKSRYLVTSQSLRPPHQTSNKHFLFLMFNNREKAFAITAINSANKIKNNVYIN